jgi:hypothetical protein
MIYTRAVFMDLMAAAAPCSAAVTISTAATQNMNCSGGTCTPTATKAVLNAGDLQNYLFQFGNVRAMTTGSGVEAKDIVVDAPFATPDSTSLTLEAHDAITVNAAVSVGSNTSELELQSDTQNRSHALSFARKGHITFGSLSGIFGINGVMFALVGSIQGLANAVATNPGGAYALANNYDASDDGVFRNPPIVTEFTGFFDGLGNAISHVEIKDKQDSVSVGFFSLADQRAIIENVNIEKIKVTAADAVNAGGITGINRGLMRGCHLSGSVYAGHNVNVGGLVGANLGVIQNSYTSATVTGGEESSVGGLVGSSGGHIAETFATGLVTGARWDVSGGLVGVNSGAISGSFAAGAVVGKNDMAGGLVGSNTNAAITDSYAIGSATAYRQSDVGGLIGNNYFGIVRSAYSIGQVTGGARALIGGFAGVDSSTPGSIRNSYWDTDTSGITNPSQGAGQPANDPGITALTTEQLQAGLPKGFGQKVWAESRNVNNGLPYLINNPPPK